MNKKTKTILALTGAALAAYLIFKPKKTGKEIADAMDAGSGGGGSATSGSSAQTITSPEPTTTTTTTTTDANPSLVAMPPVKEVVISDDAMLNDMQKPILPAYEVNNDLYMTPMSTAFSGFNGYQNYVDTKANQFFKPSVGYFHSKS